ncbi:ABC transporter substrate-binding protein [Acidiphilium cryptum]|uniref:Amino acid/amide ABC transporter substrate-binding protein, HAAT family n=2 Tax=Acidiphilium TaxID=522 RepID=A5FTY2_ACICJ|nr:ABC transporter substrate-binding protein [Acidiphilium cryptum]ABQ29064.1 amino acid/amide ABC transporter substrate-binding protein, HAAT family [Acidiphilium cryptum JF-5]
MKSLNPGSLDRRGLLKAAGATGASSLILPNISWAASEKPVKIGMIDPRTGTYAAAGFSEIHGATMAIDEINKKGGILGRPVQMFVEDSESLPGPGVTKAQKLVAEDKVNFLMGAVNSATAESLSQFALQHNMLYIDTGGHVDDVTGSKCHWTTFRTCSTTWMLTAGDFETLFKKFGKKWFFITPDYAFGHAEHRDYVKQLQKAGGKSVGNALAPLGTTDFSSYLIRARAAKPDVLICLQAGDDLVNLLKQAVQFGLDKQMAIAGALQEMEVLESLPKAALLGWWTFEWYWNQPGVPHVADFVTAYKRRFGDKVPTARSWFGYVSAHSIALAANQAKTLDSLKVVKALEGMELPPEIALQPGKVHYRAGDHQMMANMFPGYVPKDASYPNLFKVADVVPSEKIALSPAAAGCKMTYPS